ncbi:MAG TPA: acyl-[ACP]--phospholipid O-acyltransferase [Candidatus Rifleibacterium sp.]|nr:acyl-[ACP]--phospholipid O-acyltransferase [Candidatus Rifleibacterium sp.]
MTENSLPPTVKRLLIAQFFGAFNDNAWKMIVAFLAIKSATTGMEPGGTAFENASQLQTTMTFVVFTLPMVLFSLPAGVLADRVSKTTIIIVMKALEVLLMAMAIFSLAYPQLLPPLIILALMGMQSALFSPAKYGILPELLPHDQLSKGNGALEMWTFIAIIGGTASGGLLLDFAGNNIWVTALILTILAIAGLAASLGIPQVTAARGEGGFIDTLKGSFRAITGDRVIWLAVLGSCLFWAIASLLGQDILVYAKNLTRHLPDSDTLSGLPLAFYGLGVGLGSVLAGRISGRLVEYGLIPLGATGIGFFTMLFGIFAPGYNATLVIMTALGISSGLVVVPLNAILQWRSPAERRGGIIALANVFIFAAIVTGSLGAAALSLAGLSPAGILVFSSLITTAGMLWAIYLLPDFLIRLVFVIVTHTFYRLTISGGDKIPLEGGALLVPNHVSFIDGFLVMASTDRQVRFIVDELYYNHRLLHPFMKAMHAIPVSATGGLKMILRALRDAGNFIDQGDLVCIFAEGQVTRTGLMLPFRRGLEKIVRGRAASIIPVNLDRVWGSIYSRSGGRFLTKLPETFPYPITVTFGDPLPADTSAHQIRIAVQELATRAWDCRRSSARPLHHYFIRRMRTGPWRVAFADSSGRELRRLPALISTISLARSLKTAWGAETNIGILMPPTIGGALANVAATMAGKVPVNLNFTAGRAGMTSALKQAGISTIITSREFVEKAALELPEAARLIYLEDQLASISPVTKLAATLAALLLPISLLEKYCGTSTPQNIDSLATIIFSSGSTGEPKGVMLSHHNVGANVEAVGQVLTVNDQDRLLGILPLFHSFGFMSLWFAVRFGMSIIFHPNPLDAAKIGEVVEHQGITFLIATPTFLQIYMRRCSPGQFGSLRIVFTGAEKLTERLAGAFEEKFGIKPIEGYGATECSPAITVSTLDFRGQGIYQFGSKRGFVGHPLPGVSVRIVDVESGALQTPGSPGLLLVKGPNVMQGYIGREDLTAKALKDGWYNTGDIAVMDESGFVRITDRLSRFSKIGGEMVPHGKVEDALHEALGSDIKVFAVTAVPDERKGETLAVVHTIDEEKIAGVLEKMSGMGLPNLFIPKKDRFVKVDKIPLLGTGKVDLRGLKETAMRAFGQPDQA